MKPGLLVISHGSREAGWVALVEEAIEAVRSCFGNRDNLPIEAGFLELVEGHLIQDGLDRLAAKGVTHLLALPLFVSSGSTHVDEIGWALGAYPECRTETELERYELHSMQLTYGHPMDDDEELVDIVLHRLQMISEKPSRESVLLIGHGSEEKGFKQAWESGLAAVAEQVVKRGKYRACETALLLPNQVDKRMELLGSLHPENTILVKALFLSEGYFTKDVVPRRLRGYNCRYDGSALMPHVNVSNWMTRQAGQWLDGLTK